MPSSNVCQVLMYVSACQSVPGHDRDDKACQQMLGEFYAMLGPGNRCLGVLAMEICSRYKYVLRHVRCQGILVCAK